MPMKDLNSYVLKDLYGHEVFMKKNYEEQLKILPQGRPYDCIERIYQDEIRHCETFNALLKKLDHEWDGHEADTGHRKWSADDIREMLEFDQHMEEELEGNYMENLSKLVLEEKVNESIVKIMKETHAHSEILKVLLSEI